MPDFSQLLASLKARLVARVSDEASLIAASAARLREWIAALRQAREERETARGMVQQALARLEAAATDDDLETLWGDVPLELEEPFLHLAEQRAAELEQEGNAAAAALRTRRDQLLALQQQQRENAETMRQLLEQLAREVEALAAADQQGIVEVWNRIPLELEELFLQLAEARAADLDQTGDSAAAARLRERATMLRQAREERETARGMVQQALARLEAAATDDDAWQVWLDLPVELEEWFLQKVASRAAELEQNNEPQRAGRLRAAHARMQAERSRRQEQANHPVTQALQAFLQAPTDADAARAFNERRDRLQPFEAQRALDDLAQQAPPEAQPLFRARAALLRSLRCATPEPRPEPRPALRTESLPRAPESASERIYINSAHAEGGGDAIVINNIVIERRWTRPRPERLAFDTIERTRDLERVAQIIAERGQLAIAGGRRTASAAIQGMPGIGKTVLARQLALALDERYPGGVIWEEIGPEIVAPEATQPILNRWARYALSVPPHLDDRIAFDAGAVRALFAAQRQPLLVILDNVWSLEGIRWLRAALPDNAHLVITTRLETVMVGLGGGEYVLDLLTPDEARALIALRLGWNDLPPDHHEWADALAQRVGYHTLALDIAIRRLRLDARSPDSDSARWRQQIERLLEHIRSGQGFERLALPDSERNQNVEAVLAFSYDQMDDVARARFRALGAFAPEAPFGADAAAALWQCDHEAAEDGLSRLANAALLEAGDGAGRWRQHSLLRGYALALLRREGEHEAAAARHAAFYASAMRAADDAQRFYELLGDYPQLRHAFAWAIENDLDLAQNLIANSANLQRAHGYGRDTLAWAEQALAAAVRRGTLAQVARAQGSLGNALQHAATLAEEDRPARLRAALAAYDEALRFYTPSSAPLDYAATQNNRGTVLQALATLAEEDRPARLRAALAAYDEALRFYTPSSAPLDYAMTQTNRGTVLQALATLAEEDRPARLRAALAAYDEALRFYTPSSAPLDYATTQNNRGTVLQELATLAEEDRPARLRAALAAYDEALRFYTPSSAPLDYATTQNNRGTVLQELATLAEEDRPARLRAALAAYDEALRFYTPSSAPLAYATTQNNRGTVLRALATLAEEDRPARLRAALAAYDEALRFYTPSSAPLDYAWTQTNRGTVLQELATLAEEDRPARLRAALAAYDEALRFRTPSSAPLAYATTQNNRGTVLQELATLAEEDRPARLRAALAAYDEALRFYTPSSAPLDYAATQNNRGNVLQALATLAEEDRPALLRAALAAYDEALRFRTPSSAPLDYAMTQTNRGAVLQELATLAEEDRPARLRAALAAYDEALRFYTPSSAPLDYAVTQNNRGAVLQALATLAEEDRPARLRAALAAYDEALRFYTPSSAPLAYAATQGNLLNLYQTLASEPGEDRTTRLLEALRAGWTAFRMFTALQHAEFQQRAMRQLRALRTACGADFDALWASLGAGPPPEWLSAPEEPDLPQPLVDLLERLAAAGVTDDAGLLATLEADPQLRAALLALLVQRLLAVASGEELLDFWRALPAALEEPLAAAAEEFVRQAEQAGDAALARALRERAEGLRAIRAAADAAQQPDGG